MKKESKLLKILRTVRSVILTGTLVVLVAVVALILITRLSGGTPSAFGYTVYRVSSGSMSPNLEVGDVILTQQRDPMTVKKGDIITYEGTTGDFEGKIVTHRVVKEPFKKYGEYYVRTKGDANIIEDPDVNVNVIRGVFVTKVSIMSFVMNFFVTPWGLVFIIFLVVLAFFNEIVNLVKAVAGIGYDDEKKDVDEIIAKYKSEELPEDASDSDD